MRYYIKVKGEKIMSVENVEVRNKSNSRKAGLELLRMFAALFVVMLHYREIAVEIPGITNTNKVILYFLKAYVDVPLMFSFLFPVSFCVKHRKEQLGK